MLHIKVPATTANMGPGFDCIGMAFQLYNELWIEEADDELIIENNTEPDPYIHFGEFHSGKNSLIYRSIVRFYKELGIAERIPGLRLIQKDGIPMTRGLGSSAACVVAGLIAANKISKVDLPIDQLANLAARIEEHPDNTTPALLGGMVVCVMDANKLEYIKLEASVFSELKFAAIIPEFTLSTRKSRIVLPNVVSTNDAVYNISRTAMMMLALASGDYSKLKTAMNDRLHQLYRVGLIPELDKLFHVLHKCGAKGAYLSGSGPAVVCVYTNDGFPAEVSGKLSNFANKWKFMSLLPCDTGATAVYE